MPFCKALLAILVLATGLAKPLATDRPNVIYILADDLGYGDLSHAGADAALRSPGQRGHAVHRLAHDLVGMHATRYGIVTGRYNWRTRLKSGVLWGLSGR